MVPKSGTVPSALQFAADAVPEKTDRSEADAVPAIKPQRIAFSVNFLRLKDLLRRSANTSFRVVNCFPL